VTDLTFLGDDTSLVVTDLALFEREITQRVAAQCANMCGSQADQKNIRRHFGLDYYDGPSHYQSKGHLETQYDWNKHYVEEKK
jgi:hypothetical protein